jgi:hypothetical protein
MAQHPTVLPGWGPLAEPPRRFPASSVLRWWWPAAVTAGFLVLVAVVGSRDDPAPGPSIRGLATLTLAAVALTILTIRRRFGPWALVRALAEYAVLVLLVGLLVTSGAVPPAERALAESTRPPAAAQEAASLPPGISQVTTVGRWLADAWRRAGELADQRQDRARAGRPQPLAGSGLGPLLLHST